MAGQSSQRESLTAVMKDDSALFEQPAFSASKPRLEYRKRRLSAPSTYLSRPAGGVESPMSGVNYNREDTLIVPGSFGLIPQIGSTTSTEVEATKPPNSCSISSVLEGYFSFPTPSVSSSASTFGTMTSSSAESSRFFSVSSGSSLSSNYAIPCALEEISIWRIVNGVKQVCAQSFDSGVLDYVSLHSLDSSSSRYGIIHEVVSRAGCPCVRLQIPVIPHQLEESPVDVDSVVSVLASSSSSVQLIAETYTAGTLHSSCEILLDQGERRYADGTLFLARLPQHILDIFKNEVEIDNSIDDILILRFKQQHSGAELYDTLLVLCEFKSEPDHTQTGIKVSLLQSGFLSNQEQSYLEDLAVAQTFDKECGTNDFSANSSPRNQGTTRTPPKLSVAIPPSVQKDIQIYSETPISGFPHSGVAESVISAIRANPLSEIPQTALPMTPPEPNQNLHSMLLPTPSDSYYPFTLSTSSPGDAPSPAIGVLDRDPISPAGRSAPPWNTVGNPFTPSFFQRFPQTAANHVPQIYLSSRNAGTSMFPQSPGEDNDNMFLSTQSGYPDSPSVYSAASYRSPI